jgi:hypothetical protein
MSKELNIKYHSTGQYRNVVKHITNMFQYKGQDEEGKPIYDKTSPLPTLDFIGTVKLHGTNASIVLHEDGVITFHSKKNTLGYLHPDNTFELLSDNSEFAQTMQRRSTGVKTLSKLAEDACKEMYGKVIYPIKISGEWVGQGIQKGVSISMLNKSLFVFGVKAGDTDQENKRGWLPLDVITDVKCPSVGIFNIMDYPVERISIDFNNPTYSQNTLVDATNKVEELCPVAKEFGHEGIGEGLVWQPVDNQYSYDSGTWFKTKGEKHSVSKIKSVASVCPEKLNSIKEFVEYTVTDNRLEQGLQEVGLDQKLVGAFIGWVNKDINKEEGDTLEASNLSMKDVGKYLANKSRKFYIDKLNAL